MSTDATDQGRRVCVTSRKEEPLRLESLEDDTYLVPYRCHCTIAEDGRPTVALDLHYTDGALRIRSLSIAYSSDEGEIRSSDLRLSLSTYARLAMLTVAFRRQPSETNPDITIFYPVAPYGGTAYFTVRGTDITPAHMGDWDEQVTEHADNAIRNPYRRSRRPYGRLDTAQRQDHLTRIASIYLLAAGAGEPPIKTIMSEEFVSRPTASRWVKLARESGHLPPSDGPHGWRELKEER